MTKPTSKQSATSRQNDDNHLLRLEPALAKLWAPKRHLLDTSDLTADEAQCILELSAEFKRLTDSGAPYPVLSGKTVANVFYENSTRTRSSSNARRPHTSGQRRMPALSSTYQMIW